MIRRKQAFAGQLFLPMRIFSPLGRYAAESGVHPMSRTAGCRFGCARLRKTEIIQFIQSIRVSLGDLEGVFARRNFGSIYLNAQIPTLCQDVVTMPRFILPCRGAELSVSAAVSGRVGSNVSLAWSLRRRIQ